ncbi:glycoside hydrolase N-terminal domain-containing protein [Nonomuraea gerenzanensis]|uniref:Putative large secreted protein n=1 Tax=Nonomuraea gerenzanensis TaxID=93944 RepID=A0A1M4E522_9ACTN|nr:glycoside hydrolase N-terminal domain-containing protein [Nonomuraea gerenzanensis]UBU16077.1 glycoside hydrolase family 95 protein [Nonomuraea gerenzanensis]SBO93880.1 putative large secreted protein [Nonomuraea gerenzanensis]
MAGNGYTRRGVLATGSGAAAGSLIVSGADALPAWADDRQADALELWYTRPAEVGLEALPEIRRLVWEDKWQAARNLADENLLGTPSEQAWYQVLGDLTLSCPGSAEFTDYRRELDLTSAVTSVRFTRDGVRHQREVFASNPDQVVVLRHTADRRGSLRLDRLRVADPAVYGGLARQPYGLIGPVRLVPYGEAPVG